jgi:glycine amidinotransferase
MPKIVKSWDEWSALKRVIIGRPEGTNVPAPEPAWWYDLPRGGFPLGSWGPFPQEMVDAANEQMDYFVGQIEKRGVIVDRIDIQPFMFNQPLHSPLGWTQLNAHGVNNVRDVTMIHGHYIVEGTTCRRSRVFERFNLRPLFEKYYKEDPEVVHFSAPFPMLTDESYVNISGKGAPDYYYYFENVWTEEEKLERLHNWEFQLSEKEALWDAADAMRFGKDIFHQGSCVTNKAGMDWLKRMFAELGIRVHHALFDSPPIGEGKPDNYHPWHIDVNLVPLRPGLCMYNPDWAPRTPELWELFKQNDWELVPAARPTRVHKNDVYLTGLYEGKSWISMNTFSIDEKTVCVEAGETAYIEQLEKLGFEVVPIPYEKVIPFGGALHCTTLDVYRESECEDYFPKQVKGY